MKNIQHHSFYGRPIERKPLSIKEIRKVIDNIFDITTPESNYYSRRPKYLIPRHMAMLIAHESGMHHQDIAEQSYCDRTTVLYAVPSIKKEIEADNSLKHKYLYAKKILGIFDQRQFKKATPSINARVEGKRKFIA